MKPSPKHSPCVKRDTENVDRDTQTPGSQPEDDGLEATRIGPHVRPFDLADRKVLGVQGREMGAMKPHALALMHGKTSVNNGDSKATHIGPDVRPFNLTDRKVLGEMEVVKPHTLALMHAKNELMDSTRT